MTPQMLLSHCFLPFPALPAGSYACLSGLKSFIQWTHPCIRMSEAKPALINLPPCTKDPILLGFKQGAVTEKQKIQRAEQHRANLQQRQQRQAKLDAAVQRWRDKSSSWQGGPDSPFVMVSYEDSYTKVGLLSTDLHTLVCAGCCSCV
jgi:hypothetical protein